MSESANNAWAFADLSPEDSLDIDQIFGSTPVADHNPFDTPPAEQPMPAKVTPPTEPQPAPAPLPQENPIAAAFTQKAVETAQKGLLEKPPVFYHKGAKEVIEDASITFEELRIQKSADFADLEEGKFVSWTMDYCGIRKEVKDPKGTTIQSMKETMERSREFLEALKKAKDKNPDCFVKPKVVMKTKGVAAYKGHFSTVEDARASDKVICLIPARDGQIYELRKTAMGEFLAPKHNIVEFPSIRAGFTPALPRIPRALLEQIIAFFRSFLQEQGAYEALALIYWDTVLQNFFAYIPQQEVGREHIQADLRSCPYDDDPRYIRYADIHSHHCMEAYFSAVDDRDERETGLYLVVGQLDRFYPALEARFFCGDCFIPLDPADIVEGFSPAFPAEWSRAVTIAPARTRFRGERLSTEGIS